MIEFTRNLYVHAVLTPICMRYDSASETRAKENIIRTEERTLVFVQSDRRPVPIWRVWSARNCQRIWDAKKVRRMHMQVRIIRISQWIDPEDPLAPRLMYDDKRRWFSNSDPMATFLLVMNYCTGKSGLLSCSITYTGNENTKLVRCEIAVKLVDATQRSLVQSRKSSHQDLDLIKGKFSSSQLRNLSDDSRKWKRRLLGDL